MLYSIDFSRIIKYLLITNYHYLLANKQNNTMLTIKFKPKIKDHNIIK